MALTVIKTLALTGVRKMIATRMRESLARTAPVTLHRSVALEGVVRLRQGLQDPPSFTAYIAKALGLALKANPVFNSHLVGDEIRIFAEVNLGVAVALPDGLIVPVVRNVPGLSVGEVHQAIRDLAERARSKRLTVADLEDATCSLTNLGMYGVDGFTPILNPPQTCILGVGRVRRAEGPSEAVLSLTFDHQVVDGAQAAQFLGEVAALLETPEGL